MGKNFNRADALIQGVLAESIGGFLGKVVGSVQGFVKRNVDDYRAKGGPPLFNLKPKEKRVPIRDRRAAAAASVDVGAEYRKNLQASTSQADQQANWVASQASTPSAPRRGGRRTT